MRRYGVLLVFVSLLVLLLWGCGGSSKRAQPQEHHASPATLNRPPKPKPRPKPKPKPSWVRVIVQDGDLSTRVPHAVVHVMGRRGKTNRHGVARILLPHRGRLVTTVAKRGYDPYKQRLRFTNRPLVAVRVFQTKLQWSMYGASPHRTQQQPYIRLRPPFRLVWSKPVGALIEFPAVVSDEVAFVSNFRGVVRAFSMRTGGTVWRRATPHGKMAASPAVFGKVLVVHGMDGHVWVLDRYNGRVLWTYSTGSPIESSPVVIDGVDYFGNWAGRVYALNLRTHRARWTYGSGYKITSSAAVVKGTVYIGDYGGQLLALSRRNGHLRWSGSVGGRIYGTPAVANGRIFVPSSTGGSLTAFSTRGSRLWSVGTGAYVYASPAVWNGRVYVGSYTGVFYCLSAASGGRIWSFPTGGAIGGASSIVDGIVYFANRQHRIYGLNARTGRQVFRFPDGAFVPVSGNGRRLLLHGFSRLYAVEPRRR
jgi:outer membrane protein assembly factor BamB